MKQYIKKRTIDITITQDETLDKLKNKYKVNVSQFIRNAIAEKIKRDYKMITYVEKDIDCPF